MRSETERLTRVYYACFNARDVDGFLALLAGDIVHDISQSHREKGKRAFRKFLLHMNRCYRETAHDVAIMVSADDARAAAEFKLRGKYLKTDGKLPKASGQRYRLIVGAFFEIKRGKIARISNHYNKAEWLRQVGGAHTP